VDAEENQANTAFENDTGIPGNSTSASVGFASVASKTYTLETSTDLATWTTVNSTTANATTATLNWISSNQTDSKRFFRVKVSN